MKIFLMLTSVLSPNTWSNDFVYLRKRFRDNEPNLVTSCAMALSVIIQAVIYFFLPDNTNFDIKVSINVTVRYLPNKLMSYFYHIITQYNKL